MAAAKLDHLAGEPWQLEPIAVWGPPHVVTSSCETPTLDPAKLARCPIAANVSTDVGLHDRALIGLLFARHGDGGENVYAQNCRLLVRLHRKSAAGMTGHHMAAKPMARPQGRRDANHLRASCCRLPRRFGLILVSAPGPCCRKSRGGSAGSTRSGPPHPD
jgi:hypothetical protein